MVHMDGLYIGYIYTHTRVIHASQHVGRRWRGRVCTWLADVCGGEDTHWSSDLRMRVKVTRDKPVAYSPSCRSGGDFGGDDFYDEPEDVCQACRI